MADPFRIDVAGRAATEDDDAHLRSMIRAVLFTNPGERVNLPEFGAGLRRLVFEPNSEVVAAATQFLVHGSLQRWLGDLIEIRDVRVTSDEERLHVDIAYVRRLDGRLVRARFTPEGSPP